MKVHPVQTIFNVVLLLGFVALLYGYLDLQKKVKQATVPTTTVAPATPAAESSPAPDSATKAADVEKTVTAAHVNPTADPGTGAIVYVESAKLLEEYQGAKDARKAYEAKAKVWQSQSQTLNNNFKAAVEQYQKTAATLTPEQRAATEQKLQAQQQQGAAEMQRLQTQAQEAEAKLTQGVLEKVNKRIEAYGKARGYKMILIASANGSIAYAEKGLDVTAPVLAYLNAGYKK